MIRWERWHTFSSVLSTVLCSASCELCKTLNCFWFIILSGIERQKPDYCLFSSFQGHTEAVRCLRFSPDGKWVASAADDHTVKVIYCDILLMCLWECWDCFFTRHYQHSLINTLSSFSSWLSPVALQRLIFLQGLCLMAHNTHGRAAWVEMPLSSRHIRRHYAQKNQCFGGGRVVIPECWPQ